MNNIERLEEGWFFHDHAWQLLHQILKEIKEIKEKDNIKTLLDFGAGSGIAAAVIKAIFPEIEIYVCDIDENIIKYWQDRNLKGELLPHALTFTNYLIGDFFKNIPNQYDIIIVSHVIEHLNASGLYLQKFAQMAKHLILVVPDNAGIDIDPDHKHIFNRISFKQLIDDNIQYKFMKYYPLYHPHINNLIAVIDL